MSEVRLDIREDGRDWSGTIHGSSADRAIAADLKFHCIGVLSDAVASNP